MEVSLLGVFNRVCQALSIGSIIRPFASKANVLQRIQTRQLRLMLHGPRS
jgi:hypothetical protein